MLNKEERHQHQMDLQTKLWNKDLNSLSMAEVNDLLSTLFYQVFLVEINDVKFTLNSNEGGTDVKFEISGECFRDAQGLDSSELVDLANKIHEELSEDNDYFDPDEEQ